MKIIAIIPARGGSKGIPHKNITPLKGKPLIAWTIEQAQDCPLINDILVSTDDEQIASIAKKYGGSVPFMRPQNLAQDTTPDLPVYQHVLEEYADHPDIIVWLRPTSPLRQKEDITNAINLLIEKNYDCVRSVTLAHHHPYWMKKLEDHTLRPFIEGHDETVFYQRQTLPPLYYLNGAIDVIRCTAVDQNGVLFGGNMGGYILPAEHSIDIDTPLDLKIAEVLLEG